ncbi:MAG TPA: TetR/AcrR family transcriptional regulator [Burkholderiaceae bacterium]|nr:TetR/AcrR family transcriptional regulator [Burkholderiaceae bacterium]
MPATRSIVTAGRPTLAEAKRRVTHLVDVAERLFVERGYDTCSIETIAREAQVAGRTIYAKFGGKAGLLAAVVEKRSRTLIERTRKLDEADANFESVLREFAVDYLWETTRPAALALRRAVVAESTRLPEVAAAFHSAVTGQVREALARQFARPGLRVRLRRDVDTEYLAGQCLNTMLSHEYAALFFGLRRSPTRAEITRWAHQAIDLFLQGALAPHRTSSLGRSL